MELLLSGVVNYRQQIKWREQYEHDFNRAER